MNYNKLNNIRNYSHIGHIDSGKTTLSERLLYYSGRTHKMGEVHNGEAIMDSDPREQKRGITINAAATSIPWNGFILNLIDVPGHLDFSVEVERSLRVLDGAVCVIDGSQGVEPQTEQVWRQADRYNVSRIIFVNKMDKVGANFQMSLDSLRDRLGIIPLVIQLPYGEEDKFDGVIDLIKMEMYCFNEQSLGKEFYTKEIPPDSLKLALTARENMIETLSDTDDVIMEKFLDGDLSSISNDEIKNAIRKATFERTLYPILCGSALRNKGIQMLLDAIVDYLPSPIDLESISGISPDGKKITLKLTDNEALAALAFKVVTSQNGNLTFIRIYSGTLNVGDAIYNSARQQTERIGRLVLMHANKQEPVESAFAGSIVVAIGFRNTYTGDTLCNKKHPVILEKMEFPDPVVELSVEPKSNADQDKLSTSLQKLMLEDPSLKTSLDEDTGQTILKGMGELHLEIVVDKLRNEHNVGVNTGKPKVSYRETIIGSGHADCKYVRQSGGRGQYGHVVMNVSPGLRGSGLTFVSEVIGGTIPKEYLPSIEKGVKGAMDKGALAGYPLVDIQVSIIDGSYHTVDSSSNAFEIAGSLALQQAVKDAGLVLLEPLMSMEVVAPEQYMGDVISTISSRGGQIRNTSTRGNARVIEALMPLRNLFGYTTELRGRTQGRAVPSTMFSHYEIK